jgi:hypothetical protein
MAGKEHDAGGLGGVEHRNTIVDGER